MLIFSIPADAADSPERNQILEDLLSRVAHGDQDAFGELYERTRAGVYAVALSYLRHHAEAEDVTQNTYIRVWDNIEQYTARGTPMAWILSITRNLSLMALRQRGREDTMDPEDWDHLPAPTPAVTTEDRELIRLLLESLDDQERQIVVLHTAAGLKHREIAEMMELPLSTVLSKYSRAIRRLKCQLEGGAAGYD